jgi:integrase
MPGVIATPNADVLALAAEKKRNPHWQRLGIKITPIINRTAGRKRGTSWSVIIPAKVVGGRGRERRQFKTYSEALHHAQGKADMKRVSGTRGFVLTDLQREDAAQALPILTQLGMTFTEAAKFAEKHLRPVAGDVTFRQLADLIMKEKEREKIRPASMQSLNWHFDRVCERFGETTLVKAPSREEFSKWVNELQASGASDRHQKNLIRYAQQLFRYAMAHGYRADNPAALVKPPRIDWKPPTILTLAETRRLLATAMTEEHRELLPALVLQLFVGGVRSGEVQRLNWGDINLEERKVSIEPSAGKNRRAGDWRIPTIPENAVEFLLLHGDRNGPIAPDKFREKMTALHKAAGFTAWDDTHKNAKRHTFGSMGCKLHGAPWVQDQMGHNTGPTFLRFYRNARVTASDAAAYFKITPRTEDGLVPFNAAAS